MFKNKKMIDLLHHTKEITPHDLFLDKLIEQIDKATDYDIDWDKHRVYLQCDKYTVEVGLDNYEVETGEYYTYYNDGMQRDFNSKLEPLNEGNSTEIGLEEYIKYANNSLGSTVTIKLHKWDL